MTETYPYIPYAYVIFEPHIHSLCNVGVSSSYGCRYAQYFSIMSCGTVLVGGLVWSGPQVEATERIALDRLCTYCWVKLLWPRFHHYNVRNIAYCCMYRAWLVFVCIIFTHLLVPWPVLMSTRCYCNTCVTTDIATAAVSIRRFRFTLHCRVADTVKIAFALLKQSSTQIIFWWALQSFNLQKYGLNRKCQFIILIMNYTLKAQYNVICL